MLKNALFNNICAPILLIIPVDMKMFSWLRFLNKFQLFDTLNTCWHRNAFFENTFLYLFHLFDVQNTNGHKNALFNNIFAPILLIIPVDM